MEKHISISSYVSDWEENKIEKHLNDKQNQPIPKGEQPKNV